MITHNGTGHASFFQRMISLLLCLVMLGSLVPNVSAAQTQGDEILSDEITLTEEQASAVMSSVFGEDLPLVETDGDGYGFALTDEITEQLLSGAVSADAASGRSADANSNQLPADYVDDSNEELNEFLAFASEGIAPMALTDASETKVDLVFVIDSTGSMYSVIHSVKNNVAQFAKYLSDMGVTLRLGLIDYRDITADGLDSTVVHKKSYSPWFDITSFIDALTTVSADGGGDTPETAIDALGHLTEGTVSWNSDAYKFAMLITDADYKTDNQHGIASMSDMISRLQAADIQVSVITDSWYMEDYGELAAYTGGVQADINDNFGTLLEEYADAVIGSAQTKKNYTIQINEKLTNLPVANALVSWNGGSTTTNASGTATITTRSNPVQNFTVSRAGYVTYSQASFDLTKNGCVKLQMDANDSSDDLPSDVPVVKPSMFHDLGAVTDTFKGPSIKLLGKTFNIFEVEIGMDIPIFKKVSVSHDGDDKMYSVVIGADILEGTDPDKDPYWKEDYKKYKSLVETFSDKKAKDIYNEFRTLRKNNKPDKADLAFPVDMSLAGYVDISYATGKLQIVEGGVVIGVSTKEFTVFEWPLPPAPYVYFQLTFQADAKGTFTIAKLDSSAKLAFSVGLKEISVSPSLAGTLNLGVPKLASVGGGLSGTFDFIFNGLPPKKLAEILTIKGNIDLIVKIKLLGFEASPKVTLGKTTLYPSSKASKAASMMNAEIEMSDFTRIQPANYPAAYGLTGLSDTLTFEKLAYSDSTPQLVAYGDGWMMVWADSDASRPETDHMALYFSIYTEADGWSAPVMVDDDGTGDFSPSLVVNTDKVPVVVWQDSKAAGAETLEEQLTNTEISAAVFDAATGKFGAAVTIPSTEGFAPLSIQAVSDDDGVSVYWLENQNNNPFLTDGSVTIMTCDLQAEGEMTPTTLETGIYGINGFAAGVKVGQSTYAYTTSDGTNHTLYCDGKSFAIGSDCRSTQFVGGDLYWSDSEGLKCYDGFYIDTEAPTIPADFTVVPLGTTRLILVEQYTGSGGLDATTVYASVSRFNGTWSNFAELKQYEGTLLGTPSIVKTSSGILWASAREFADGASLVVDTFETAANVVVDPEAYVSVFTRAPGEEVQVMVDLTNMGLANATDLQARLPDGTLADMSTKTESGEQILHTLVSGSSATAMIPYTLPADMTSAHEISIDIIQSDGSANPVVWGTAKVTVEAFPDLAVENVTVTRNASGSATVAATVANHGHVTAAAPSVSLAMENTTLISSHSSEPKVLPDLAAGASAEVSFEVPEDALAASSPYDYKRFIVTATSETGEYTVSDNSASALLAPLAVESIAFDKDSVSLDIGKTHTLKYHVLPAGSAATLCFMSNDTTVVTVSEDGVLTPLKAGSTTVSVLAVETGKVDEIAVTVKGDVNIGVNGVSINPGTHTLEVGQTVTLNALVSPENASNKAVIWNTDTSDLLRIDGTGSSVVVTALQEGTGLITVVTDDGSYTSTATITIVPSTQVVQTVPMFRLYNPNSGEHFYTGSPEERDILVGYGWNYEGVAWNAPIAGGAPVHRVYNPNSGDHHYTTDWSEVEMLVGLGWQYENVAWNCAGAGNVPQYRLWNPNADLGSHHYTSSEEERDNLVSLGWILEGIGWYGYLH